MSSIIIPSIALTLPLILIILFDGILKGIALWKTGRNNHLAWFVCILIFNTVGILPIIYLLFFQPKPVKKKVTKKRR